jgi:hypothetical protein
MYRTHIQGLGGYRAPLFFLRYIKFKRVGRGTNLTCDLVRRLEVGRNCPYASVCQCQCYLLTDTFADARD